MVLHQQADAAAGGESAEIGQCSDQARGRHVSVVRTERRAGVDPHETEAEIGDARDPPLQLGDVGGEPVGIGPHEITHVDGDIHQRQTGVGRAGGEGVEGGIVEAGELERHRLDPGDGVGLRGAAREVGDVDQLREVLSERLLVPVGVGERDRDRTELLAQAVRRDRQHGHDRRTPLRVVTSESH